MPNCFRSATLQQNQNQNEIFWLILIQIKWNLDSVYQLPSLQSTQHNISCHALFSISLSPTTLIFPASFLSALSWLPQYPGVTNPNSFLHPHNLPSVTLPSHQLPPSVSECFISLWFPLLPSFHLFLSLSPSLSYQNPCFRSHPKLFLPRGEKDFFCSIIRAIHWNMHDLFGTQTTRNPLFYVENGAHKVVFILVVAPLLALTEPTDEIIVLVAL